MGEVIRMDRAARELELVERIAYWMDRRYVDPLLALLLPGVGDVIATWGEAFTTTNVTPEVVVSPRLSVATAEKA